ncbi:transmembrane protein 216-like protein [Obelidium mucronatum]|nr:transmembrane protein 216-like protein [Obelidium mucronatum]
MEEPTSPTIDASAQTTKKNAKSKESTAPRPAFSAPKIYSSLPLQIVIYFNERFFPVMWLTLLGLLIYKGAAFPYAGSALPLEIFGLFPFAVLEAARLFLGHRGNKMEDRGSFGVFLGLTVVTLFAHLFYCIWQTYVTIVDLIVCGIGLSFVIGELISGIAQMVSFHRIV